MLRTLLAVTLALAMGCATQEEPAPSAPAPVKTEGRAPTRPEVAPLKEQVSRLNARLRRGAADVSPVLSERAEALAALMDVDAGAALALALPESVRTSLARKHPAAARHLEERGAFEGEWEVLVADSPARTEVRMEHFLRVKGERLQVRFAHTAPGELRSGLRVRVQGLKLGARVAAEDVAVVPMRSALSATSACTSTGDQRTLVILATFPGQPQTLTVAQVREVFFSSTQRSLTRFWSEASQGRTTASGDVVGWYTLDRGYSCNESDAMRVAAIAAADADVDFRQYDRVFIVHPEANGTSCYYGGLGTLACGTQQTQDGPITASTSWLRAEYMSPNDQGVELVTHEAGHNLTLHHASSRDFGAEALGPVGVSGSLTEYGDLFSTMGSWNLGQYAAPHKVRIGWLEPGAVTTVDGTDGTFTVSPLSAPLGSGVQALKVRRGFHGDGWLWLEARRPVGDYDVTLPSQVFGGAVIHYEDPSTSSYTHLLDFTPETPSWLDPALLPGATWTDPYTNLRLTVDGATPAGVTVSVHYEPVPCVRAPPTVEFDTWYEYAVPGWQVESGLTLTNHDTVGCPASTFAFQSSLPAGWPTADLPASITLEPGKQRFLYFSKQVPEGTPYATYTVDLTVSREEESVTVDDTLDVIAPCQTAPIEVRFDRQSQVVTAGDTAAFGVTLINHDSRACGWVYFEPASTLPQGWTTEYDQFGFDIEAGGSFEFTMYKAVPTDAQGTYGVDVQVLRDGYTVEATATATVTVNPCVRVAPTFTAQPATVDVEPGGSASYTLSLTNHDPASCGASTFTLDLTDTEPWASVLSAPSLTVTPGGSATATLTVTAPVNAGSGSRYFELGVLRGGTSVGGAELEARVVCRRNAPAVSFTPATGTVEAGKPLTFAMKVTNTDNTACTASSFTVGATVPAGWTYGFAQPSLTLAAGASGTVGLTVTPPETAAGSYTLSALASHTGASTTTGALTVNVTPPPLKATVSVPGTSYKRNSAVPLTTTVKRGTLSAQASVRFSVSRPDGVTEVLTVSTDVTGKAAWSYTARVRGTHSVTATATSGTETATSNTVSFSVQ
ncbi:NEW3 domain-containing protein [Pyxidicoccus caerfyrddinensis]|uniref:NEW3 domain-containing protein n=1 Tax=Pyxidicoccus caerfyrddinensis TaxID=2709663 RepID=UPI0013DAA09B|nr:NEW3 domain-containing protein [Pyxidicoccus caerfyrddinensis]